MYGDREGTSSVQLVLSWPLHIKSWERDNMSWPRDRFVKVTTSLCRGLEMLCWGNNIHFSWPQLIMLRERHIFLVATSLMHKQIYVTIGTRDYQRWIKHFLNISFNICILLLLLLLGYINLLGLYFYIYFI